MAIVRILISHKKLDTKYYEEHDKHSQDHKRGRGVILIICRTHQG